MTDRRRTVEQLETVVIERDGPAVIARIDRPERMNALYPQVYVDLERAFALAEGDADVRALVLTGTGDRAFCAGGDKKMDLDGLADRSVEAQLADTAQAQALIRRIRAFPLPVIARVNGVAVGGGLDIALACDSVIAVDSARFGSLWIQRGIVPALGGAWFLPRMVGTLRAKQLLLTGELIDAAEALRIGLVTEVVPAERLDGAVDAAVAGFAAVPALALARTKALVNRAAEQDLESYFDQVAADGYLLTQTAGHAAGMDALKRRGDRDR